MNDEISTALDTLRVENAQEIEERNLASVQDQIMECDQAVHEAESTILHLQDAIRERREFIRQTRARRATLGKKRRIFARAAFELREVDNQ